MLHARCMATDTGQLLTELRKDHRDMAVVLNVLADSVAAAERGENPDFELVEEIMRYMTVYPDAVHHPKEDVVYAELQRLRPELASSLEDIPRDHREIAELGIALRDDATAVVAGVAIRREKFVDDCNNYVKRLRNHMMWEEDQLFPLVDELLEDQALTVDVEPYLLIRDPVFELEIEPAFQRLVGALRSE